MSWSSGLVFQSNTCYAGFQVDVDLVFGSCRDDHTTIDVERLVFVLVAHFLEPVLAAWHLACFCTCTVWLHPFQMRLRRQTPAQRVASRHDHHALGIPSSKMTTLDPEPFGKPTLLLESNPLLDTNDTFISSGLLDIGVFSGSGNDGEGEGALSTQSPPCAARSDAAGSSSDDELFEFTSNGLLDGSTRMGSTVNLFSSPS